MNITFLKKMLSQVDDKVVEVNSTLFELYELVSTLNTYIEAEESEQCDTHAIGFELHTKDDGEAYEDVLKRTQKL